MDRQTKPARKSRGGCARCKQRRIKCDETRPKCQMCRANRTECPGYERPLKWLAKHQQHLPYLINPLTQESTSTHTASQIDSTPATSSRDVEIVCADNETVSSSHDSLTHISPEEHTDTLPDASMWPSVDAWDFEDLGLFNIPLIETPRTTVQLSETSLILNAIYGNSRTPLSSLSEGLAGLESQYSWNRDYGSPNRTQEVNPGSSGATLHKTFAAGRSRFLETYYRLTLPGRDFGLSDQDFVNHYFQNVCAIISCFDSDLNPLRSLVEEMYPKSSTIHLIIQSMAVSHLSNYYPQLVATGLQKRSQAWQLLQRDLYSHRIGRTSTDTVLLSLLLLGLSAAWLQPSNTGMQYLLIARNTVLEDMQKSGPERQPSRLRNDDFFQNALMYWEMLASFIDPVPITPLPGKLDTPQVTSLRLSEPTTPHPWTGLLPDVNYALAEVGRILQRQRAQVGKDCYRDESFCQSEREWASYLERFLTSLTVPTEDGIADYGDSRTPKVDLILATESYRLVGLLELYAIFPQLLPKNEQQISGLFERFGKDGREIKPCTAYKSDLEARLAFIATHILDLVNHIAISSAACRLLPLVFVACSSYLRFPDLTSALSEYRGEQYETIVQARSVVEAKMLVLSRKYPQAPLLQMLLLVKEVWQRLDDGNESAHWINSMHEKGWQTLMG